MFTFRPSNSTALPSSSVPKNLRCSPGKYSLSQSSPSSSWSSSSTSPITENDLLKYEDLNMDLKELNALFKDLTKKKTQKNSNLRKLSKQSTQSNRNSIEKRYKEEEIKFVKNIKKILSEKIREKALHRLERLIKNPKEERLNKVACTLAALIEVLKSCGVNEDLIKRFKDKITKDYPPGLNSAEEFIKNIIEKNNTSLTDFISKQLIHNKKLGEVLTTTIKELQPCNA